MLDVCVGWVLLIGGLVVWGAVWVWMIRLIGDLPVRVVWVGDCLPVGFGGGGWVVLWFNVYVRDGLFTGLACLFCVWCCAGFLRFVLVVLLGAVVGFGFGFAWLVAFCRSGCLCSWFAGVFGVCALSVLVVVCVLLLVSWWACYCLLEIVS